MSNLKLDHPELINQWHLNNKPMETYTSGSGQKVLWICDKNNCGCHEWKARIYDRTRTDGKKNNCPYCNKRKACIHNNAAILYPNLIQEWHPKNKETLFDLLPFSSKNFWWLCTVNLCGCHNGNQL